MKKKKQKNWIVIGICPTCIGSGIGRLTSPITALACPVCGGSGNSYITK